MKKFRPTWPIRPLTLLAVALATPAFYLVLTGPTAAYRLFGSALYGAIALLMAASVGTGKRDLARPWSTDTMLDLALLFGAAASAWPTTLPWPVLEWVLRLAFCCLAFLRLSKLVTRFLAPHHLLQVLGLAAALLAVAGAGFYWLEPKVPTYGDGLWLAFITGATVGYGDLVPSTPASRIFAVFIVLLGYAVFSVVTASISALFVSVDEKSFEKELHNDIRALREEIAMLRDELHRSRPPVKRTAIEGDEARPPAPRT